jgi:hypothetical protein
LNRIDHEVAGRCLAGTQSPAAWSAIDLCAV